MKKTIMFMLIVMFSTSLFTGTAFSCDGAGGNGGNSGGDGNAGGGNLESTTENNTPPGGYQPIDPTTLGGGRTTDGGDNIRGGGMPGKGTDGLLLPQINTTSVDPTEPTVLTGESVEELVVTLARAPGVKFAAVTAGGIMIGFYTAGLGYSVAAQALAAGGYSVTMTAIDNVGQPVAHAAGQVAYSGGKDIVVGFIPVSPPVQAAISTGIDYGLEAIGNAPGFSNSGQGSGGYGPPLAK